MIRIALVAPAAALRLGLRQIFSTLPEVEVIAEAASLEEAATQLESARVLVMTTDSVSFSEALNFLSNIEPLPVLLLTTGKIPSLHELNGLNNRAWGLLPLEASPEELQAAVQALNEGLWVGASSLVAALLSQARLAEPTQAQALSVEQMESDAANLTERELEVLQLLAQGLANKQIAARLNISEHTVKFHVSTIYAKLGASSRTEAVRLGVRQGLIVL